MQSVLDNTGGLSNAVTQAPGGGRVLALYQWHAVSMAFPESDPGCGPGSYVLVDVTLPLSLNATLQSGTASVVLQVRLTMGRGKWGQPP